MINQMGQSIPNLSERMMPARQLTEKITEQEWTHECEKSWSDLKELLTEYAANLSVDILEMEIMPDHVHMLLEVDPQFGIHKAVKSFKGYTSRILRQEFPYLKTKMPTLWTNSYFVSTVGGAPLEAVKQYIENQKTSQRQKDKMG